MGGIRLTVFSVWGGMKKKNTYAYVRDFRMVLLFGQVSEPKKSTTPYILAGDHLKKHHHHKKKHQNPVAKSRPLTSSWSWASRTRPAHWPHSSPQRPVRPRILGVECAFFVRGVGRCWGWLPHLGWAMAMGFPQEIPESFAGDVPLKDQPKTSREKGL